MTVIDVRNLLLYWDGHKPYRRELDKNKEFLQTLDDTVVRGLVSLNLTLLQVVYAIKFLQKECKHCKNACTCYNRKD